MREGEKTGQLFGFDVSPHKSFCLCIFEYWGMLSKQKEGERERERDDDVNSLVDKCHCICQYYKTREGKGAGGNEKE